MNRYTVILEDFEQQIDKGKVKAGQKLPSVREAARIYNCSISTVIRAYTELEQRHMIYSIPQSGYYFVGEMNDAQIQSGVKIDFTSSSPDLHVFPYRDFQHCLNQAIDQYRYNLFTYGNSRGLDSLRQTLVRHLASHQVFAKPDQIRITAGIQQTLDVLARMPFPNGKNAILVEQPSYNLYLEFLVSERIQVLGIERTVSGIDLQQLEHLFKTADIKFFYTMSRYQNPLGTSYDAATRQRIADLAAKYDVYVVEDDYMADIGDGHSFDPIYAYDLHERVIYLKSFSKVVFPGLRIGATVLPAKLIQPFDTYKRYNDASLLSQAALDIYIKSGMYERYRAGISRQYAERLHVFHDVLRDLNDEGLFKTAPNYSGVYVPLYVPRTVNLERVVERLDRRGIMVFNGKKFYLDSFLNRDKFLRISISRASEEQIISGMQAIVEEITRQS